MTTPLPVWYRRRSSTRSPTSAILPGRMSATFWPILAGLRCDNTTYTYSSALLGFIHLGNALYSADPQTYWAIRGQLDGRVEADLKANSAYWDQFTGKLEQAAKQASNTVYNGFLQKLRRDGRHQDIRKVRGSFGGLLF